MNFLGIEIGGTKLQLGVATGAGRILDFKRRNVNPREGAEGILRQVEKTASALMKQHRIERIGIGFGGPVDAAAGKARKSHQIQGWDRFPLVQWAESNLGVPTTIANDCDAAALAEARLGAGRDKRSVFYVTVGTGVGGGFVLDGQPLGRDRPAIAEIGHLRPGLHAQSPGQTVESIVSGWGIVAAAQQRILGEVTPFFDELLGEKSSLRWKQQIAQAEQADEADANDLQDRCGGDLDRLTARTIAEAAEAGNHLARDVLRHAVCALGWAIAQVVTLLAPEVVVVGGGVASMNHTLFLSPLRSQVTHFVFPPLVSSYQLLPAQLGDRVVVHGAVLIAAGNRGGVRTG